ILSPNSIERLAKIVPHPLSGIVHFSVTFIVVRHKIFTAASLLTKAPLVFGYFSQLSKNNP
ncbi:MAG: hypothetical protein JW795_15085, partial [Chitinivibrionales bacterium]|nr:hypothetical protein [Chitinivibrionales bacterium]